MPEPIVSIIIVNFNGIRFLKKCLESVYKQSFPSFEVVFVDNGSTDGSIEFVRKNFPETRLVENGENLGFAAGNNRGIGISRGGFILTLNNDTELKDDFLISLMNAAQHSGKDAAMWAPKILSMEKKDGIDSVGGLLIYPDGSARGRGRLEKDIGQYDKPAEVFIPSACCALYKKEMLDSVGLFDEDFFAYCEDTDLGLRARLVGWKTLSVPDAVVYHYYSGTAGGFSPFKAFLVERNRIWVTLKILPTRYLLLTPFYTLWRYSVHAYGLFSGKGPGARLKEKGSLMGLFFILLKAYFSAIGKIPSMLLKRKEIRKSRRVPVKTVGEWLKRYSISAKELVLKD
ncbi:MAG: glycosyltransferase family 2 protein [Deltaproteobacteria bacterium]|nr:glycosyltransferase family 2 protein [Deltaproteobacteria bacterium]